MVGSKKQEDDKIDTNPKIDTQRVMELEKQIAEFEEQRKKAENELRDLGFFDQEQKRELSNKIMALEEQIDVRQMAILVNSISSYRVIVC